MTVVNVFVQLLLALAVLALLTILAGIVLDHFKGKVWTKRMLKAQAYKAAAFKGLVTSDLEYEPLNLFVVDENLRLEWKSNLQEENSKRLLIEYFEEVEVNV